jgi:hypothetical protein
MPPVHYLRALCVAADRRGWRVMVDAEHSVGKPSRLVKIVLADRDGVAVAAAPVQRNGSLEFPARKLLVHIAEERKRAS